MLGVLDEEVLVRAVNAAALGENRILATKLGRECATMREFPRLRHGGGIMLNVFDVATALKDEGFQTLFAKLLGGPATGHS